MSLTTPTGAQAPGRRTGPCCRHRRTMTTKSRLPRIVRGWSQARRTPQSRFWAVAYQKGCRTRSITEPLQVAASLLGLALAAERDPVTDDHGNCQRDDQPAQEHDCNERFPSHTLIVSANDWHPLDTNRLSRRPARMGTQRGSTTALIWRSWEEPASRVASIYKVGQALPIQRMKSSSWRSSVHVDSWPAWRDHLRCMWSEESSSPVTPGGLADG